jgi:signal peptidase I
MTAVVAPIATFVEDQHAAPAVPSAGRHRAAATVSAAAAPAKRTGVLARLGSALATLLLAVGILALLFMTVAPRVFHYRTATMLTGSMVPTINPGDIVIDTEEPAGDIAVGQIISYHIPVEDHRVESHRVVWVGHTKTGNVEFRTKGDANTAPDPWTAVVHTPTVWRVRGVLPVVGTVIRTLRAPAEHMLLAVMLPVGLVLMMLWTIWKPKPAEDATGTEAADGDSADATSARKQRRHR